MGSKIESLRLDLSKARLGKGKGKDTTKTTVADSWEDDDAEDDTQTPTEGTSTAVESDNVGTHPPPPTPMSAIGGGNFDWSTARVLGGGRPQPINSGRSTPRSDSDTDRRRPEKTTATAGRMIAASLGIKAPKKTEEQKQYDRAVREQEIKRKNREKEARERDRQEDDKAKDAVWDS